MFLLFMSFLMFVATHKISIKVLIISLSLVIVALFVFGCLGNIRSGSHWQDSSYILNIAKIDGETFPVST